jgi:hypothetical protein
VTRHARRPGRPRSNRGESNRSARTADDGRAMIEVVFLAVLLLIPTVYVLAVILRLQSATFAVTQAARDAGRVIDAAPSMPVGVARAEEIAGIALADQGISAEGMAVRFVSPGSDCVDGGAIAPTLEPGAVYDVCVVAVVSLPGVPTVITGSRNTVSGAFTLHVGDFREAA